MKTEQLRRTFFVGTVCLLSFPWLTPCVGIWSAAAVNGAHDGISKRDQPLAHLPTKQLKEWAAIPGPKLAVIDRQNIPRSLLITENELSDAKGGMNAPRPGTVIGKGASAVVDGLTYTLTWIDPFTLATKNSMGMAPTKPLRHLILCESPFVLLEAESIRFTRSGKDGPILLARATGGTVTVITPDGSYMARAQDIYYRGPSDDVLLVNPYFVRTGDQFISPVKDDLLMKLNFKMRTVSCNGAIHK